MLIGLQNDFQVVKSSHSISWLWGRQPAAKRSWSKAVATLVRPSSTSVLRLVCHTLTPSRSLGPRDASSSEPVAEGAPAATRSRPKLFCLSIWLCILHSDWTLKNTRIKFVEYTWTVVLIWYFFSFYPYLSPSSIISIFSSLDVPFFM